MLTAGLVAKPERWLWAIAALGVLLRVRAWLEGRSLWLDESFLAINLIDKDLWTLISQPLANNQSAPPGFLFLTWLAYQALGQGDLAVRFVPLLAGSLVPFAAALVAKGVLKSWLARFVFVAFTALSPVLVFYSAEFKQYSIDVLATMLAIHWWANWERLKRSPAVLVGGAVLAVCSLTAVLVFVLMCLVILAQALRRDRGTHSPLKTFSNEFGIGLIVTWSSAVLLHLWQALLVTPAGFMVFWWSGRDAFAPLPFSLEAVLWYPLSFVKLFFLGFATSAAAGPGPELGPPYVWISGLVLAVAAVFLRSRSLALPMLAIASAYLLAALRLYPFSSRLALYLLPLLFLLLALALEPSPRIGRKLQLRLVAIPTAILLAAITALAGYRFIEPTDYRDMKWAIDAVSQNAAPEQILAIDESVSNQVNWYRAQGIAVPIETVQVPWSWDERRYTDTSAVEGATGVWTLSALAGEEVEVGLRVELERLGFKQVCYVFEDFTSVALHVPVELAESQVWECDFPQQK